MSNHPALPTIRFGDHQVTRLIMGGNPFAAYSHFTPEMDQEMRDWYTPERVVEVLQQAEAAGINTVQARGDYHRILYYIELFRRAGGKLHWIAQTASEMHDVFQNIRILGAAGAIGIYHHGSQTDKFWKAGKIDQVEDYLKCMRDQGVMVGMASHMPEVIEYAEDKGWDLDFYMTCFYNLSREERHSMLVTGKFQKEEFRLSDRDEMTKVIRQTDKLCLGFKIMAASRLCETPEGTQAAFDYAYSNIKPTDAVVVGMFPKYRDQVSENVQHALKAMGIQVPV